MLQLILARQAISLINAVPTAMNKQIQPPVPKDILAINANIDLVPISAASLPAPAANQEHLLLMPEEPVIQTAKILAAIKQEPAVPLSRHTCMMNV